MARTVLVVALASFGAGWMGGSLRVQMAVLLERSHRLDVLEAQVADGRAFALPVSATAGALPPVPAGSSSGAPPPVPRSGHCTSLLLSGPAAAGPRPCPGEDHRIVVAGEAVLCICQGTEVEIR